MPRSTRLALLGTLAATGVVLLIPNATPSGAPFSPPPSTVLDHVERETVADSGLSEDEAAALALRLLRASRLSGSDTRRLGRAQAVLAPWWTMADAPPRVRLARAQLKLELDDVEGAVEDLATLREPEAVRLRAKGLRALGRLGDALEACRALEPSSLEAVACEASVQAVSGGAAVAAQRLSARLEQTPRAPQWALTTASEASWLAGRTDDAAMLARRALERDEADAEARLILAAALVASGRGAEVPAVFSRADLSDAELLAFVASGYAPADLRPVLDERMAQLERRGDGAGAASRARFALLEGEPARALELALANFSRRKNPGDVELLLEAALAAKAPKAAAPALDWLESTGFEWPRARALAAELR